MACGILAFVRRVTVISNEPIIKMRAEMSIDPLY